MAGIDIGNSTTEVALAGRRSEGLVFLSAGNVPTTGIKGTPRNIRGIKDALRESFKSCGENAGRLGRIYLNDATPVLGDLAMSTITETVITESTMIGHNPGSPGGLGVGYGTTVAAESLHEMKAGEKVIAVVSSALSFTDAARLIGSAMGRGVDVQGAVVQNNDGVLIANRLVRKIPIVDEVAKIDMLPLNMPAVIEVAKPGRTITELCNPYGLATLLGLDALKTALIAPVAMSLLGNRSAVVVKTPGGMIRERIIPAGNITISGSVGSRTVDISAGAEKIMGAVAWVGEVLDASGESGTIVGGMLSRLKDTMGKVSRQPATAIRVSDIFAVDTTVPGVIRGAVAGEVGRNTATGLAAMIWSDEKLIKPLVEAVEREFQVPVDVRGTEVHLAIEGTLTTPGIDLPLFVLDMGAGSIDAGYMDRKGICRSAHLAGAGEMVTRLIDSELELNDRATAELVKTNPAARVESLFSIRMEDGSMNFFNEPLEPGLLGRNVLLRDDGEMTPVLKDIPLVTLAAVRRRAKEKVFISNATRALKQVAPASNLRTVDRLALIGGCALDFEIPGILSEHFFNNHGVLTGTGNIRGRLGPRNAVATGLVLAGEKNGRAGDR